MSAPESSAELSVAVDAFMAAEPSVVFRAFTTPELFARWMGPEGSTTVVDEMDPVPGGRFAMRVRLPDGPEVAIGGEYSVVEPPRRLVHTWTVSGDDDITTVTVEFHDHEGGTRVVLHHAGFRDGEAVLRNDGGWRHQFERLERLLASTSA